RSIMGEMILKHYAPSPQHIGLHFEKYDTFIHPPIIKDEIVQAERKDLEHITVYLPSFQKDCLEKAFNKIPSKQFHWFLNDIAFKYIEGNITYFAVNHKLVHESLIHWNGLITGGRFATPAEASNL